MGNLCCCCIKKQESESSSAFQGQGHRLGGNNYMDAPPPTAPPTKAKQREEPPKALDPNLDDIDRQRIREERLAAAEARLKKNDTSTKRKNPKKDTQQPLRGPNSENLMRWTTG